MMIDVQDSSETICQGVRGYTKTSEAQTIEGGMAVVHVRKRQST